MKTRFFLLLASIMFATSFITSCSVEDLANELDTKGSSSSGVGSGTSSNSTGSTNGGTWTPDFSVTDTPDAVLLSGKITARGEDKVSSISITANGDAVNIGSELPTLPAPVVNLAGVKLSGVCALDLGNEAVSFKITVTFVSGEILTQTASAVIDCSTALADLDWFSLTLSYSGKSYADLELGETYGQGELTAAVKKTIDLIAFYNSTVSGKIYSPVEVAAFDESDIWVDFLPANEFASEFKSATSYDEFEPLAVDLYFYLDYTDTDEWVTAIDIASNVAFIVWTEDDGFFAVVITDHNVAGKTVTVKVIPLDQFDL